MPSDPCGYLIAGERLRPEGEPRELSADHLQLVFRVGFVEPVDHSDQRADVLLGLLKELLAGLGRHRTSSGRTATVGHDQPSLHPETDNVAPAAGVPFLPGAASPGGLRRVRRGLDGFGRDIREPGRPALKLGSIYECRSKWRAALFIAISFAFLGPCYKKFCAFVNYLTLRRRKNVRVPIGKFNARRGDANARMDRGNRRRGRDWPRAKAIVRYTAPHNIA